MRPPRVIRRAGAALLAASLLLAATPGPARDRDAPRGVRDLAYGEVLFRFYQQDHFGALVRLTAALERNEVPSHAAEAELLLGALYLSYGQHRLAGEIFERLLAEHEDPEVHDRAWFFLAKIWRQRGYFAEAEAALARVGGHLPASFEPERRLLAAELAMDQGRFEDAERLLAASETADDEWARYAEYNLGVALVRQGRIREGAAVLERIGSRPLGPEPSEAIAALRDKANVALGYAWLQAGEAALAKPALKRVRLEGPFSNKALLGVGWADAELAEYRAALVPWLELKGRTVDDPAVQESLLAVPYAFARLGADGQAADHYLDAITAFDTEIERIEGSIAAVRSGALIDALLEHAHAQPAGWYYRLDAVPDTQESRYLYELLSTHGFQESLKNLRDLKLLIENLDQWKESLSAFDDILETRWLAFERRRPVIDASLDAIDLDDASSKRVELESRIAAIERSRDVVALGTADQRRQWHELEAMGASLARLGDLPEAEELRRKHRFLQGLLLWDLERDYKARLWELKASLRRLDLELKQAQARHYRVTTARDAWPEQFAEMTHRIDELVPRIDALRNAAVAALERQRGFIEARAIEELEARRARLAAYRVQARFSLAAIYDRASARAVPVAEGARP
ncbi:MAG: hypothetical protein LOD94_10080 [Gammaproteobacteria bacterium]